MKIAKRITKSRWLPPISAQESKLCKALFLVCEVLCGYSIVRCILAHRLCSLLLSILSIFLLFLPSFVEKLFKCKLNRALYIAATLYAMGPLLGEVYKLYYITSWWDKLLHCTGGVVFAMLGAHLASMLTQHKGSYPLCAVFALCFSMAVSVTWEFYEYASDTLFGTDMQNDTVITAIHSYELDPQPGVADSIEGIHEVSVDGKPLPFDGYLDIGLHDTMQDMLVETFGALVFALTYLFDKGRHPVILPNQTPASGVA